MKERLYYKIIVVTEVEFNLDKFSRQDSNHSDNSSNSSIEQEQPQTITTKDSSIEAVEDEPTYSCRGRRIRKLVRLIDTMQFHGNCRIKC